MSAKEMAEILEISEAEAKEVIKSDAEIDKGADPFPLTDDQKKVEKAMRGTGTRKTQTAYSFSKRVRKPNDRKRLIIDALLETVKQMDENAEATNPERVIAFTVDEKRFELTLIEKRK